MNLALYLLETSGGSIKPTNGHQPLAQGKSKPDNSTCMVKGWRLQITEGPALDPSCQTVGSLWCSAGSGLEFQTSPTQMAGVLFGFPLQGINRTRPLCVCLLVVGTLSAEMFCRQVTCGQFGLKRLGIRLFAGPVCLRNRNPGPQEWRVQLSSFGFP